MAESLLVSAAGTVLGEIATFLADEATLTYNLRSDLTKFQNTIDHVKAVIFDAEELASARLPRHEACTLSQLKDVLSDAEDVLSLFAYYEAARKRHVSRFFRPLANYRSRLGHKMGDIIKAFDEVAANKTKFHLNNNMVPNMVPNKSTLSLDQRELTHSLVTSRVIGRDGDRDTIVRYLMDSASPEDSVSVVSIVGIGGMGKTALAKMVFGDQRVVNRFEKKIWVCLGDIILPHEFTVKRVMAKLVKSIFTGDQTGGDWEPEQLQSCLREKLRNKRFLLVLDDVWVMDSPKWSELKEVLMSGVKTGSKVMVTTRDSSVAENMGSNLVHNLKHLTDDDQCVSLFKVFASSEKEVDRDLMKIGDSIVGKCKGVPLAIKTLGCLLSSKRTIADWKFVRDSELWKLDQKIRDGILPALKLSYNHLPFVLKRCFVYCVVFPKDYQFSNVELITHWSGYGLLESGGDRAEKDIGEQYINELCVRGFFQDFEENLGVSTFKMHDLFHDLALSFTQSEFKSIGKDINYKRIRHASFSYSGAEGLGGKEVPKLFSKSKSRKSRSSCIMPAIWSVSFQEIGEESEGIVELLKTCIPELENLRIMDLRYISSTLKKLPSSIGDLKLLTYLSLVSCASLKILPDSICQLYNLQTLSLYGCESFEKLPKNVGDLVSLTTLELTTKQARLSEGDGNGIESLSSLQELGLYGCENLKHVFEPRQSLLMSSLQTLRINNCKSLTCLAPSAKKSSRELSALETLYICECPNVSLASTFNNEMKLVRLRWLVLGDLPQIRVLPEWIGAEGCAATLEFLGLESCENLEELPQWLCNLTSLRRLIICGCPKLRRMPGGLGALKDLEIGGCRELSQRCKRGGEDWPNIEHVPKINLEGEYQ